MHKYDTEDYRHVDPQFGGDGALLRLRHNTQQLGIRLVLDGVFNHSGDSHAWFDRHNRGTGGACHNPESPWRDWYSFSDDGTALDWLGYASLPKLDYQSESLVNEIYRGEDSIVRHWLKAPWNMDGWRLDVVHMLGEAGGARNNLQHVAGMRVGRAIICSTLPGSPKRRKKPSRMRILSANILAMHGNGYRPMWKMPP